MKIVRDNCSGVYRIDLVREGLVETHVTVAPRKGDQPAEAFARLKEALHQADAHLVKLDVLGPCSLFDEARRAVDRIRDGADCPITWAEGRSCTGDGLAGIHAWAVSGAGVDTLPLDGWPAGRIFQDDAARYCVLGGVYSSRPKAEPSEQARETLERLENLFVLAGMSMGSLVRSWFFNADILAWYGPFNAVRNQFFTERKMFDGLVPASTGIGAPNPAETALTAGAIGIRSLSSAAMTIAAAPSPLQCPAPEYGSAFSRAVEIVSPGLRRLLISGTASIDLDGRTVHVGDAAKQVRHTMDVVQAILEARGMGFADVTRAYAYFVNPADVPAFARDCADRGIPDMPAILTQATICRDDLLFEIELDAVTPAP